MHLSLASHCRRLAASLKWRIALGGVAALALGIGITTTLLVRQAETNTLAASAKSEHNEAVRAAGLIGLRVAGLQQALAVAAAQLAPGTLDDEAALLQYLQSKPVLLAQFGSVFISGADGRMRLIHDKKGFRRPGIDVSDRDYFRQTMATGQAVISEPMVGRMNPEPVVVMTYPLTHGTRTVGVLSGAVWLKSRSLLAGVPDTTDSDSDSDGDDAVLVAVTAGNGQFVSHPDTGLIGASRVAEPRLARSEPNAPGDEQDLLAPPEPEDASAHLLATAAVPGTTWTVWRSRSHADVLAPLANGRNHAARWAAALVAVLAVCLFLLLTWLLQPLAQLRARAQHLFDGQQDPAAGWPGASGEIGAVERVLRRVTTERAQLEAQNQQVIRQLESVMAAAPVGIAFTRGHHFELVSRQFCLVVGRDESLLLGQSTQSIYTSNADYLALGPMVAAAFAAGRPYDGTWQLLRADGSTVWAHLRGQPVDWHDAEAGTIWTVHDATDEVASREALEWSASHDSLTGLANRKAFEQRLAALFKAGPSAQPAALVMFDLDRFKPINDQHGHAAGDAMLCAVATAAATCVRASDLLVRLGGDEFAIVLAQCPADAACRVADDVRLAIEAVRLPWAGRALSVGASFGVATLTDGTADATAWLAAADTACYVAKAGGRGRVQQAGGSVLKLVPPAAVNSG